MLFLKQKKCKDRRAQHILWVSQVRRLYTTNQGNAASRLSARHEQNYTNTLAGRTLQSGLIIVMGSHLPVLDTVGRVQRHQPPSHAQHIMISPWLGRLPSNQLCKVVHVLKVTSARLPAAQHNIHDTETQHAQRSVVVFGLRRLPLHQLCDVVHVLKATTAGLPAAQHVHDTKTQHAQHIVVSLWLTCLPLPQLCEVLKVISAGQPAAHHMTHEGSFTALSTSCKR